MIFYIASNVYNQVIHSTIKELGSEFIAGSEVKTELELLKYIKSNITTFGNIDKLIIDLNVCNDLDEEIIQAIEMYRIMYDKCRIIILAANRYPGDELLTKCFHLGILDIICTEDYRQMREELELCITVGKTFKEAVVYKDAKPNELVIKNEVKQSVNKVMVGIAGSEKRIGVTHHTIILANYLRKKGFMVAIAEMNQSGTFQKILEGYDEKEFEEGYFTINGIDFYKNINQESIQNIVGKSYNFILCDYGTYSSCDRVMFNKSEVRLLIVGSKPWELDGVNSIFENTLAQVLEEYHFCFNFSLPEDHKRIKEGMGNLKNIHFTDYLCDPIQESGFPDADSIFEKYLPKKIEPEKKGFFRKKGAEKIEKKK